MEEPVDDQQRSNSVLRRLMSGEYPESVATDLKKKGAIDSELQPVFALAAVRQRRSGLLRIIAGAFVSLVTFLIVIAAHDAGIEIYGPGLATGLRLMASREPQHS